MIPSIVLFGATSILGFNLSRLFPEGVIPFISPGNSAPLVQRWSALNLEDPKWIKSIFDRYQPKILLYCHAVCDVPKCEADPNWAQEINVGHLNRVLKTLPSMVRMVYVSSDHVFGGNGTYDEYSPTCPISVYGKTREEAECLVLKRPQTLIIRTGLPIGPSPNGRTGHLDWLRYRTLRQLPVTIVEDEYRSVVWVEDLAKRVLELAQSEETGFRHIPSTRAISRVELANYLLKRLGLEVNFQRESRQQRTTPHLGRVELKSIYGDTLAIPLPSVVDSEDTALLGEVV